MDETLMRGLIVGGALGLVGWVATLIWQLMRSPTEGARRFKLVAGFGLGAFITYGAAVTGSLVELLVLSAIIGAGVWVYKGIRK